LKIKAGGGHGGHNGIRHIKEVLGTGDFVRVKAGVGRGNEKADVSGHVLNRFNAAERKSLENFLAGTAEAVEKIIASSVQEAMNAYNNRDFS
ncbi:MAG: peptidyl-tRNA hydrolase, partial [Desulfuromonadales bacterium]|nr:peptidyl-tRNA hydrolase [Desulfuromonadales bacterium]NIS42200.1 peptidyl-tRNA hydrolase [Desulfuromonadales bacterium]